MDKSLRAQEHDPEFVRIQPDFDNTISSGGWAMVLNWLEGHPPDSRISTYFNGGLFENNLSAKECDVIVFQLDADVLSTFSFQQYVHDRYGHDVVDADSPAERGNQIRTVVELAGEFDLLAKIDKDRHVVAPAVESTETWCVAVFRRFNGDPELLKDLDLCREFMTVLHCSEGRPIQQFHQVDKSPRRRRRYCESQANGFRRLEQQCRHYRVLVERLTTPP